MKFLRHRHRSDDLRPTYAERRAALAELRARGPREQQRLAERRQRALRRALPWLGLGAFALGLVAGGPLHAKIASAHPQGLGGPALEVIGLRNLAASELAAWAAATLAVETSRGDGAALERHLAKHPWVADVRVARALPGTWLVRVTERVPVAVWIDGDQQEWLVDAEGFAFAPAAPAYEALPRLHLAEAATAEAVRERIDEGLALARAALRAGFARPEIELGASEQAAARTLRVAGLPGRVLLGEPGSRDAQIAALARLLAELPEARRAGEIDLRFAGQAVLRPPAPAPIDAAELEAPQADRDDLERDRTVRPDSAHDPAG